MKQPWYITTTFTVVPGTHCRSCLADSNRWGVTSEAEKGLTVSTHKQWASPNKHGVHVLSLLIWAAVPTAWVDLISSASVSAPVIDQCAVPASSWPYPASRWNSTNCPPLVWGQPFHTFCLFQGHLKVSVYSWVATSLPLMKVHTYCSGFECASLCWDFLWNERQWRKDVNI